MALTPEQADSLIHAASIDAPEAASAFSPLEGALPARIGPHIADRLIGSGGMGSVYHATQPSLDRPVALKLLPPYAFSPRAVERFRFEATILSRLRHPNIATIYDAGAATIEGLGGQWPYYAMEFIDDARPIHRFAQDHGLSIERRLRLLIDVADAVHHAHQRAIIHRDLKPDNILVGGDGVPKVIDFGIAASLHADPEHTLAQTFHTQAGQVVGSLQFMAPEQFESPDADVRVDVYSLGMLLYLLLTDTLPYDVANLPLPAAASRIKSTPIHPPSSRRAAPARLHRDLDAITLKALSPTPDRRYPSAAALGRDLGAHLDRQPITARPPSPWQRLAQWIGRHPIASTATLCATMILLTVVISLSGIWWFLLRPHSIAFDASTGSIEVLSRSGTVLDSLSGSTEWARTDAFLFDRPEGGRGVVLRETNSGGHTRLRAFSLASLHSALWTLDLAEQPLAPPHPSFATPEPGDHWNIDICRQGDVFPEHPGRELISLLKHTPSFPAGVAILNPSNGDVIHVAWHTGHLADVAWCPKEEAMFVTGVSNRLPWSRLGHPNVSSSVHPAVVFAYHPTPDHWNDAWLASPSATSAHTTLWYAAYTDPYLTGQLRDRLFESPAGPPRSIPIQFHMGTIDPVTESPVQIRWTCGLDGPLSETPLVFSAYEAYGPSPQRAGASRLVRLDDLHPIGDRDLTVEMPPIH